MSQRSEVRGQRSEKDSNWRLPLSVYMITFNNGATIERALQSVAGWAGEIVVVDSESTDGAQKIVSRYTDKLSQFVTTDMAAKYGRAQDLCTYTWVLFIDADEWLTDEIKDEIARIIKDGTDCDGFMVSRKNIYLGKVIKHGGWYPDHEIRLYRKDKGAWQGGIHAKVHVHGKIGRLKNYYMHTPYTDIAHQIRTVDRYSGAFADDLGTSGKSFRLLDLLGRPIYRFFRDYIMKAGFLDGIPGIIIVASTMYYVFMKYARLWEMQMLKGEGRSPSARGMGEKGNG